VRENQRRASEGGQIDGGLSAGNIRGRINLIHLSADQIAWLMDVAKRYIPDDGLPSISRQTEMKRYAMLYEVMEIVGAGFQDDSARFNATPPDIREYKASSHPHDSNQ